MSLLARHTSAAGEWPTSAQGLEMLTAPSCPASLCHRTWISRRVQRGGCGLVESGTWAPGSAGTNTGPRCLATCARRRGKAISCHYTLFGKGWCHPPRPGAGKFRGLSWQTATLHTAPNVLCEGPLLTAHPIQPASPTWPRFSRQLLNQRLIRSRLENQHRISIAVETVALPHGLGVSTPDQPFAPKRIHHGQQRGTRQMEIGEQRIDGPKRIGGPDE